MKAATANKIRGIDNTTAYWEFAHHFGFELASLLLILNFRGFVLFWNQKIPENSELKKSLNSHKTFKITT